MHDAQKFVMSKVPEITLGFWVIKIFGAPGRPARSRECKSLTVKV
jgi:uncharacterized membrane-anchored protein